MTELGRLEKVDLREVWMNEAGQFTPWLAKPDNMKLLGETIGMELDVEAQEKPVGPFSADILCRDTASDCWVVIENQLERTDHTHLGQLMTYAAGLDAVTIVWIAQRFTAEHRAALDWLNQITDEKINFFGLEVELWRIGNSAIAPKFNIVSQPNNWVETVRSSTKGQITETKQLQLEYWMAFRQHMEDCGSAIPCSKPYPQNWINHSIGRAGFKFISVASATDSESNTYSTGEIRVELIIDCTDGKEYYALLLQHKDEINAGIGLPLKWYNPENARVCRVYARRSADILDRTKWKEWHEWTRVTLEKFYEVLSPIVKELDLADYDEHASEEVSDA
jgi:hypothetical protein